MIPYTLGNAKLDKIYLDTTFAVNDRLYAKFPSKAEGLRELLEVVAAWPNDTVFHFKAWTWGYEDVWVALASALNTKVSKLLNNLTSTRSLSCRFTLTDISGRFSSRSQSLTTTG